MSVVNINLEISEKDSPGTLFQGIPVLKICHAHSQLRVHMSSSSVFVFSRPHNMLFYICFTPKLLPIILLSPLG